MAHRDLRGELAVLDYEAEWWPWQGKAEETTRPRDWGKRIRILGHLTGIHVWTAPFRIALLWGLPLLFIST